MARLNTRDPLDTRDRLITFSGSVTPLPQAPQGPFCWKPSDFLHTPEGAGSQAVLIPLLSVAKEGAVPMSETKKPPCGGP